MNTRLKKLYPRLVQRNVDALIVFSPFNISYIAGLRSRDAYFLLYPNKNIYFTDARYTEEVKSSLRGIGLIKTGTSILESIADTCRDFKLKRVGFEENYCSFKQFHELKKHLGKGIKLIPVSGLIEESRLIKTEEEISNIRKATSITIKALRHIRGFIAPGIKEIEVAAELERFIRHNGASMAAFDIIVASGVNSGFPHHLTFDKKIQRNEPVLIDMGVDYSGYKSDLTRVFLSDKINTSVRRLYDVVLKAQRLAISRIRPGIKTAEVDSAARDYISSQGYGRFFNHALGHGIGLEVHEAPGISSKSQRVLEAGMVFTVEPAIYLPGKFGIRLEDIILITKQGSEVISGSLDK